jgi:Ala-tRNA(Pro) deacylase
MRDSIAEGTMSGAKLKEFLDARRIPYDVLVHPPTYTAQETAQKLHVRGRYFAKPIVIQSNGRRMIAVVPAHRRLDLEKMAYLVGGRSFELVPEYELEELFPDQELGAMSPVGPFFGMATVLDRRLTEQPFIVFNAGSHAEAIRLRTSDFLALAEATVADISVPVEPRRPPELQAGGHP